MHLLLSVDYNLLLTVPATVHTLIGLYNAQGLLIMLPIVWDQGGKITFFSLEKVIAYFGYATLLWSVWGHKHGFVVRLNSIYTPFPGRLV